MELFVIASEFGTPSTSTIFVGPVATSKLILFEVILHSSDSIVHLSLAVIFVSPPAIISQLPLTEISVLFNEDILEDPLVTIFISPKPDRLKLFVNMLMFPKGFVMLKLPRRFKDTSPTSVESFVISILPD